MTQVEFENRAMKVSVEEFEAINFVYMSCDLNKDEFCKMWVKMNATRVQAYKDRQKETKQEMKNRDKAARIYDRIAPMGGAIYGMKGYEVLTPAEQRFIATLGMDEYTYASEIRYELGRYAGYFRK